MQVKHYKTLVQGQLGVARTQSMCWSPNNKRLAVADANRFVQLFDELGDRRDKFPTKSADGKGGKNYVVTGLAFSPDSAKIAVAQSDSIISIYRVGVEWGDKKFISNKFPQTSPVTCVCWPNSSDGMELIVFGTMEGKVKAGLLKSNKSQSLYGHEHAAVSICANKDGNKVVVGHVDGAVFVYVFSTEDGNEATGSKKLFQHSCPPYVLSWGEHICAAGQDCIVTFYNPRSGNKLQSFDFPIKDDVDLTAGGFNPSGQTLVVAAHEKLRFFDFNLRSRRWEEGAVVKMPNSIGMANTAWKHDGSRLITGGLTGAVDMFDACLKRYRLRGAFEFTYVSHNQVIVKRLATGTRIVLRSNQGFEIQRVNVHHDRYLVAHTSTTLLVGDLLSCKLSEIPWQLTGREKFVFDNPQVCMVFTAGELCLIEYDKNMLLGTCRTEERSAHRISVRLRDPNAATTTNSNNANPDGSSNNIHASVNAVAAHGEPTRVIAYLLDRQTIQVDDLISGVSIARIAHDHKIDWLELDYRARRLLFRDKQHQLFLYDMHQQKRTTLLNYCTFVQWVPGSDVVVAQNRVELCVWYSINNPDRVTVLPIKGEVEGIERSSGKTEVIIEEGVNAVAYALDEPLIEFGVAMEDRDFIKACDLLAQIVPMTPETEALWEKLSQVALADNKLDVAERCFAALGDVAKVEALHRIAQLASSRATENYNAYDHYTVQAELLMLTKEFKLAEQLLLENGDAAAAMKMWDEMNRFDESIAIAESRKLPDLETRRARYFQWLMETQQLEKAGAMKEKEGKHIDAINLYLRGGTPAKAAAVVSANGLKPEQQLLEAIAAALFRAQIYEQAGNFFEKLHMDDRAIDAYKSGHVFSRAVEFAKREHPDRVSGLEEEWGDYLVSQMHVDQAINHYSAAGKYAKAVEAAINSRQWSKAADLLETQNLGADNDAKVQSFYKSIARHYEEIHQYPDAEKYFIKAGAINDAVEMYSRAGMADHMYRVAQRHLNQQQLVSLFMNQARQLEAKGDHAGAERIFLKVNEPDQAIVMYKRARDFTNMIRLVQAHRPDYLLKTHLSLAAQFEKENNLKTAETHYVAGKDWGRAVNMYRDRDLWDDAVRVAKVHGGANAAKQVVLSRAMAIDSEDGLRLLAKFSYVEAGIESALEAQKFDLALQWAQGAQPAKVPYVYLKYAMHYEDQGDFRMAEDAFLKSGKPREAIDMYVHQHEFTNAMRVAENYDQSSMPSICAAHGRVCFQQGNYKEAEGLFMRANAPEALLKMYVEARMYSDAQRVAKEHCPEMMGDVAKRIALQSNDPQKAGAVLEENGEYQLAIETYLGATSETVNDATALTNMWVRAVKVAQKHVRNMLKEVLKESTTKLKEAKRFVEAGKCFEDCEEYKSAINMYVQGKKFDMAESLAKRISPELEDYVKRAIVQDSIEGGNLTDAKVVEEMDPEAAMQSYIANSDFDNAIRVAKGLSSEKAEYVAALEMQYHLRQNNVEKALEVVDKYPIDTKDFRFNETWMELAQKVIPLLPSDTIRLHTLHQRLVKVLESMTSAGESNDDLSRANALVHVIHIYHVSRIMTKELQLPELGLKLMLGLPRWIPRIAPDKAFYDAGMAAKDANAEAIAFVYLNRSLDIAERIEDGDNDSSGIDNHDFDATDFPKVYHLPQEAAVSKTKMEAVNSWVLTFSIDVDKHQVECKLPTVTVNTTEQMFEGSLKAPSGTTFPECAVSGYPILGGGVSRCTNCQRTACQEDWNRYVMISKCCPWCETSQNPNFAM